MHPTLLLLLGVLPLALAQAKCYYPEGNVATDDIYYPCNGVNTTFSQCCLLDDGDRCLPNGLCYYGKRKYDYRSACSDKSWETCSNACPGGESFFYSLLLSSSSVSGICDFGIP